MLVGSGADRVWRDFPEVDDDLGRLFPRIGADFDQTGKLRHGSVGAAESRLMAQRDLVDFAMAWIDDRPRPDAARSR